MPLTFLISDLMPTTDQGRRSPREEVLDPCAPASSIAIVVVDSNPEVA
jgi:hypothetical protein